MAYLVTLYDAKHEKTLPAERIDADEIFTDEDNGFLLLFGEDENPVAAFPGHAVAGIRKAE
jgi:hypothetical protein